MSARRRENPGEPSLYTRVAMLEQEVGDNDSGLRGEIRELKGRLLSMEARIYVFGGIFTAVVWYLENKP